MDFAEVVNPATAEVIAQAPLSRSSDVDRAVQAAAKALPSWRRVPPTERIQFLFKLKDLLEQHFEEIATITTLECGKTLAESRGELRRAIENVEVACGIPILMQGNHSEDIAAGIDEVMIRQPIGVCAIIAPFNFPGMIPMWFLPYAIACGNTVIVKPSEKVPMTMRRIVELFEATGLPKGVVNLVNGSQEAVEAILDHPTIAAVSFVGSTRVAKAVYERGAKTGKRMQCQGGAKNPIVILPDADMETTVRIAADSAFGCAGQRCLASSLAITVGSASKPFNEAIADVARTRRVGNGLEDGIEMGPVINHSSRERIEALIAAGTNEGAKAIADGRSPSIAGYEKGSFVSPTILENLPAGGEIAKTEIFGPVLGTIAVDSLDEAIALVNSGDYGNMACLFTTSGASARQFRYEADAGNIGINVGVAAPMAFFPFSGWKKSFFGDLHAQGRHGVEFYTQTKVVVERWPKAWTRKF
jgi:malonate-semialdehyde dehydrogenase (acetylating)/methylmalonate-semialdehyde dehydrogenase